MNYEFKQLQHELLLMTEAKTASETCRVIKNQINRKRCISLVF